MHRKHGEHTLLEQMCPDHHLGWILNIRASVPDQDRKGIFQFPDSPCEADLGNGPHPIGAECGKMKSACRHISCVG